MAVLCLAVLVLLAVLLAALAAPALAAPALAAPALAARRRGRDGYDNARLGGPRWATTAYFWHRPLFPLEGPRGEPPLRRYWWGSGC
jgi:hypothetical protein